jgi:hypothetical protein
MSLIFRRKGSVKTDMGRIEYGKAAPAYGHRSVKYIEPVGSISSGSLGNGLSAPIIEYKIPDGHCAELFAIGVQPDIDAAGATSNLQYISISRDGKDIGLKFLCNHLGKNSLPYGDPDSLQPIRLLDYPMRRGNLTIKFNEGQTIQIVANAKGTTQSEINARAKILLYEPMDVAAYYGATISTFASLPGGVEQAMPVMLFADFKENYATSVRSRWEDAYSRSVKDYEQITLSHIGVVPHANADSLKIYDHRLKWEAPEYEPYFKITSGINSLPFGDDAEYQPTQKLPSVIAEHVFTNTDMKIQVRDSGAGAATVSIQLLGLYRKVR